MNIDHREPSFRVKAETTLDTNEMSSLHIGMPLAGYVLEEIHRWATNEIELLMDGSRDHQPIGITIGDLETAFPKHKRGQLHAALFVLRMTGCVEMRVIDGVEFFTPTARIIIPSEHAQPPGYTWMRDSFWRYGDQFYVNQKLLDVGATEMEILRAVFLRGRRSSLPVSKIRTASGDSLTLESARTYLHRIHAKLEACGVDPEKARRLVSIDKKRIVISAFDGAPDPAMAPIDDL